jgi:hypothetical protein
MGSLGRQTLFITGASRGIGLALDFFLDDPGPYIKRTVALAAGGHP